jgi:hypothetical protein
MLYGFKIECIIAYFDAPLDGKFQEKELILVNNL